MAARLSVEPVAAALVVAMLYLPAYVGLRRSLRRFPWKDSARWKHFQARANRRKERPASLRLGWPFDWVGPKPPEGSIRYRDGLLIALLAGCWLYVGLAVDPNSREAVRICTRFCVVGCFVAVVGRTSIYCFHHRPPINLWGRIATFRWIIPGYDRVLAWPLLAGLAAVIVPFSLLAMGLPERFAYPVSLSLVLLVVLNGGPTLRRWALTGHHRITPGILQQSESIKV